MSDAALLARPTAGLDIEALLQPISPDQPCGEDVRYDAVYDQLREARREDDPALPQGVWETTLKRADWQQVKRLASEVLATRSKDLQVAVWLTEGLLQLNGLPGARDGIELIRRLCEQFWDGLFPPAQDDIEVRTAPLTWLNDRLPAKLAMLSLTEPASGEKQGYHWQHWIKAQRLEPLAVSDPKSFARAQSEGEVTTSVFLAAVSLTPPAFYSQLFAELTALGEAIDALRAELGTCCGDDAPTLGALREPITEMAHWVAGVLRNRGIVVETAPVAPAGPGEAPVRAPATDGADLPITSRAEAYRRLDEIADFLLRTEPHSPTPYLVKRAVQWGRMSLHDLLRELLLTRDDRYQLFRLLGMPEDEQ